MQLQKWHNNRVTAVTVETIPIVMNDEKNEEEKDDRKKNKEEKEMKEKLKRKSK